MQPYLNCPNTNNFIGHTFLIKIVSPLILVGGEPFHVGAHVKKATRIKNQLIGGTHITNNHWKNTFVIIRVFLQNTSNVRAILGFLLILELRKITFYMPKFATLIAFNLFFRPTFRSSLTSTTKALLLRYSSRNHTLSLGPSTHLRVKMT